MLYAAASECKGFIRKQRGSVLLNFLKLYLVVPLSQILVIALHIDLRRVEVAVAK